MTEEDKITTWIRAISEAAAESANVLARHRHIDRLGRTGGDKR